MTMGITIEPSGSACGALVRGIDLRQPISDDTAEELRGIWFEHHVIAFPDQQLGIEDLERVALSFGPYGEDHFIVPIAGHPHVIEVKREPDETSPIFAEAWHTDYSFKVNPPAGTLLYGTIVPPIGGDTLFADQCAAYDALSDETKRRLETMQAIHSAKRGYSREGAYGEGDRGRSMDIRWSDDALRSQARPVVRRHPETGRPALTVNPGYTVAMDMDDHEAGKELLLELFRHQVEDRFVYRHRWSPGMLTVWDNRCVLHAATGGYQGHRRLMHRITVADRVAV